MAPGKLQGCRRGVFGLSSWDPLPKPGAQAQNDNLHTSKQMSSFSPTQPVQPQKKKVTIQEPEELPTRRPMTAKYNYAANDKSPLGPELTVTMGELLMRIQEHPDNALWLLAENEQGEVGYVPATYMAAVEEVRPLSSMPWLPEPQVEEARQEEEESSDGNVFGVPEKKGYKAYKSSYSHGGELAKKAAEYFCDVCQKEFNGPKPLQAHMFSKAHREEVAYREES